MIKGGAKPAFFLLAAACASLAHLTRQDGVLLIPVLLGAILLSPHPRTTKVKYSVLGLGLYFIILSPLMMTNYRAFGTLLPPGPSKAMFFTEFEDLYSYSKELTLHSYLEWGVVNIVKSKMEMVLFCVQVLYYALGSFMSIFALIGVLSLRVSLDKIYSWKMYLPPILFLGLLFSFYSLIATFPAEYGFKRSIMAVVPFLLVIAVYAIHHYIPSRAVATAIILLVALNFSYQSIKSTRSMIDANNQLGAELASLGEIVARDAHEHGYKEIVIMSRHPWELYHSTRYKAIQIPNENFEVIYQVAQRYRANYLLLPAPREALELLYVGEMSNNRLAFIEDVPGSDLKLFRFLPERTHTMNYKLK
jgi:hypothetical protein